MELDYMQWVRIFHLLLTAFLLYGVYEYVFNKKPPMQVWWYILGAIAVAGFLYHGWRLIQSFTS